MNFGFSILDFRLRARRRRNENSWLRVLQSCSDLKSKIQNLKWGGVVAFGLTSAMCGAFAEAQQQAKIIKIGYLSAQADRPGSRGGARELVRRELHAMGYVEGKNIAFEYRFADNKLDRLPSLVDELAGLKVDLFLATSNSAALAAKNATRTIPVVFLGSGDPVALGLVDSLARPGRNITGTTSIAEVLAGKRLEILKETIPTLSRVAVLWNPRAPESAQHLREDFRPKSDLDVLVEFEAEYTPGLIRLAGLEIELSKLLGGRKVDMNTPLSLSPFFRDDVLAEAEPVYVAG